MNCLPFKRTVYDFFLVTAMPGTKNFTAIVTMVKVGLCSAVITVIAGSTMNV